MTRPLDPAPDGGEEPDATSPEAPMEPARPRRRTRFIGILLLLAAIVALGSVQALVTIALFVLILGGLVLIHEVGHFLTARLLRIRVLEFGIGFPPRAAVLRARGETLYTLNWLPIGGFVKLEGEDGEGADDPRSFSAQPLPAKILVLAAGVIMNLILAFAIFTAIAFAGDPAIGVYVPYVDPGSPAAAATLRAGDVIERVDDQAYGAFDSGSILDALKADAGTTVTLTVKRADGTREHLTATLRSPADVAAGKGALGIGRKGDPVRFQTVDDKVTYAPDKALALGWDRTVGATKLIVGGVGKLLADLVTQPTTPPQASGPVGIATQIGDVFWALGPVVTLYLAGVLSANLAVVNILPFPPLDGGRIVVVAAKALLGRRLSLRVERLTYVVGFMVLFAFLIWITAFDLIRQFGG